VVTVEGPAHLTVAVLHPHPVLLDSSMTVQIDTRMTVVYRFLPDWTVDHPHHNDTTVMTVTVMTVVHRFLPGWTRLHQSDIETTAMTVTVQQHRTSRKVPSDGSI
jgi:hypothetical protein